MKYFTKRTLLILTIVTGGALTTTAFQNCSDVGFSQDTGSGSGDPAQNAAGTPGTGTPGTGDSPGGVPQNGGTSGGPPVTGGPGGTTNPITIPLGFPPPPPGSTDAPPAAPPGSTFPPNTSIPPGTILPKVMRGEPPCVRSQWCEYSLTLDKAYDKITDFDWKTNDGERAVNNIPAGYIRAQPNVHYVPGSGHVRFLPGEVVRKIYVLNINPDPSINIVVPFIFSKCQYGGLNTLCSGMFP